MHNPRDGIKRQARKESENRTSICANAEQLQNPLMPRHYNSVTKSEELYGTQYFILKN